MKKLAGLIVVFLAFGTLAWFVWLKPVPSEAPEEKAATEVPVHVTPILRTTLHAYMTAYGAVEPAPATSEAPSASSRVAASVSGVVISVKCREGQKVEKGTPLFQLDTRSADVAIDFAQKTLERQRKLVEVDGTSQRALQEAEQQLATAQTQRALLLVTAPISGTLTRVNVSAGEAVDLATVLGEIVDLDRLVVSAQVAGPEMSALRIGQTGEAVPAQSTNAVQVAVTFVGATLDPTNGTVPVRAALPAGSGLRPGQFVSLRVVTDEHANCLAVPVECLVRDAEDGEVISVVEGTQATRKAVKAGIREGKLVEIISPELKPGMLVVTEGSYHLPRTSKVRVIQAQP
jgi:membrane fusion protein (multidrug efflux system)